MNSFEIYLKIIYESKAYLNEGVDMKHQSLCPTHNELVDTSDGMRSDLITAVCEELQELWYQYIQRSVESIAVQHFRGIFAYLLKSTKGSLTSAVVIRVKHLNQTGQ